MFLTLYLLEIVCYDDGKDGIARRVEALKYT